MKAFPLYPTRKEISLDGAWNFAFVQDDELPLEQIPLPQAFPEIQMVPGVFDNGSEHPGKRGVGFYAKTLSFQTDKKILLNVGGLGLAADIWFDGTRVASTKLTYSAFQVELQPDPTRTQHTFLFAVDNRFVPQATPIFSPYFDFYGYGGIYRSLSIQELPEVAPIDRILIDTLDRNSGRIRAKVLLREPVSKTLEAFVAFDGDLPQPRLLDFQDGTATAELTVPNPTVWSPETPHLHTLSLKLGADEIVERFGLRDVRTQGIQILLNDQPIRLLGACRHECHKAYGPAVPDQQKLEDLKLLRNMGGNFVRCVHYPQAQDFLDLCDEFGILAWEESMGWNNPKEDALNPEFFDLQVQQTKLMVKNSYNHPAIIIWAYMNECCSETTEGRPLYEAQTKAIKDANPNFLVSYACSKCYGDTIPDRCLDLCDVVAFNTYPGWIAGGYDWNTNSFTPIEPDFKRLERLVDQHPGGKGKPVIMSENGCCGIYGQHDPQLSQWSEEYQAEYVTTAVKAILASKRFAGFSIWQFIDARSYVNVALGARTKPLGMNLAGLLDENRRPKMAYQAVRNLFLDEQRKLNNGN